MLIIHVFLALYCVLCHVVRLIGRVRRSWTAVLRAFPPTLAGLALLCRCAATLTRLDLKRARLHSTKEKVCEALYSIGSSKHLD